MLLKGKHGTHRALQLSEKLFKFPENQNLISCLKEFLLGGELLSTLNGLHSSLTGCCNDLMKWDYI